MTTHHRSHNVRIALTVLSVLALVSGVGISGFALRSLPESARAAVMSVVPRELARACPDMVSVIDANTNTPAYGPNGIVDASDLSAFAAAKASHNPRGDFNGDGTVNDLDQDIIALFLGKSVDCSNPDLWAPLYPQCFVEVVPACPDMDNNHSIDASDLSHFAAARASNDPSADFNHDGTVDDLDFNILKAHFGAQNFLCATPCTVDGNLNTNGNTNTPVNENSNGNVNSSGSTNQPQVVPVRHNTVTAPFLTIQKAVNSASTVPGAELTYTVSIKNTGSAPAMHVILTDGLPSGFTFVDTAGSTRTWAVTDVLGVGLSTAVTYKVNVGTSVTTGAYTNTASVRADALDPVSATASVSIEAPVVLGATTEIPTLSLTKTVDLPTVNPGDRVVMTLKVRNTGLTDAAHVVLTDELPAGLLYLDVSAMTRTWELGTIPAGKTVTVSYQAIVDDSTQAGSLVSPAYVHADGVGNVLAQATIDVREGTVLGAETLADSGIGLRDLMFAILGIALVAFGFSGLRIARRLA